MTTVAKIAIPQTEPGSGYSSIGKKIWMAITGLAFIGFVTGHLIGNLQIFLGQDKLNAYAVFLHDLGKVLWIVRGTMALFLIIHAWTGIRLYLQNKAARPISYRKQESVETGLTSRTMIWTGIGILLYVVYHLLHFTFITTNPEYASLTDSVGRFDVYSMVILGYQNYLISGVYLVAMFALTGCSDDDNPTAVVGNNNDQPTDPMTIVDVAIGINEDSGEFSTLIAAVLAADLAGALSGDDMLTVFAPTDAAFAKLDLNADNIGDLEKSALSNILLYHVAAGKLMAEDVVSMETISMLNTQATMISLRDGAPYINDSMIVATDVPADNGVIHVIDTVLLP